MDTAASGDELALLRLATGRDRQQTAPAAPPEGLCLTRVGYGEYAAGDETFCGVELRSA